MLETEVTMSGEDNLQNDQVSFLRQIGVL